eukprot:766726-Alexandrium_andersonii.AAC.1
MSASLVGSEMCIRDRSAAYEQPDTPIYLGVHTTPRARALRADAPLPGSCLLYTSDAAATICSV